jgi:glutathione S-transferase
MIKIYGTPGSRAIRSLWMAEELKREVGMAYELVPTHFMKDAKQPAYLAINPNGRVPAMDDDGYVLFESLAINLYLAKKHPASALAPRDLKEDGTATQWSIWALTELEDALISLLVRHPSIAFQPPNAEADAQAMAKLERPLKVLDAHMAGRTFIMADRFTVADLNVASVLSFANMIQFDFSPYPALKRWLEPCLARPALAGARALKA